MASHDCNHWWSVLLMIISLVSREPNIEFSFHFDDDAADAFLSTQISEIIHSKCGCPEMCCSLFGDGRCKSRMRCRMPAHFQSKTKVTPNEFVRFKVDERIYKYGKIRLANCSTLNLSNLEWNIYRVLNNWQTAHGHNATCEPWSEH